MSPTTENKHLAKEVHPGFLLSHCYVGHHFVDRTNQTPLAVACQCCHLSPDYVDSGLYSVLNSTSPGVFIRLEFFMAGAVNCTTATCIYGQSRRRRSHSSTVSHLIRLLRWRSNIRTKSFTLETLMLNRTNSILFVAK